MKKYLFLLCTLGLILVGWRPAQAEIPIRLRFDVRPDCPGLNKEKRLYYYYGVYNIAAVMETRLKHKVYTPEPVLVRILCNREVFKKYQQRQFGYEISQAGYYHYSKTQPEIGLLWKFGDKELTKGIFHEAAHMLIQARENTKHGAILPFWFNEGIAGYFGNAESTRSSLTVGISWRNQNVEKWVANNSFPTLKTYFKLSAQQQAEWQYTREIGESLIHYMMETSAGRKIITQLIDAGYARKDLVKVLDEAYPGGIEGLQTGWQSWLKKPRHVHTWSNLR